MEDDSTAAMSRYDTANLDNEETMALTDDARTLALPIGPEMFSEVQMETDKPRVQRGLDDLEGEIISGRYRITRRIGKGGMGVVYLAAQTNLDRNVCIKVLNPALLDDADAVGRFEREARGLSRLQHPNIVTIFDYGRDGNLAYIVMEYAQGETLGKYLKAHGPLKLDEFLPIAVQVLKGIGEAHKMGLIHRDIKPANIVLCELEGEKNFVKILDFGLAKLAQGGEDLTKDQQLVGSASYMSPEQILTGASDTRTDVYALGVMFYLMLSGHKPFTGSNDNAILYQHVNAAPPPLEPLLAKEQNVPTELCQVIQQCLMKSPDKRPQTAIDLLTAISYALDAPQLRAGYSSMTLQRVEQPKGEEEAPVAPPAPPQLAEAIPAEDDISKSLPPKPQAPTAPAVEEAQPDPTVMLPKENFSTETRDRKILIITVCCVAALVSIILSFVITTINNKGNNEPNVFQKSSEASDDNSNAEKNDAEYLKNLFVPVEKSLTEHNWAEAHAKLNDIKSTKPEIEKTDEFKVFNKRIRIGQELEKIQSGALDNTVIDKSDTLKALKQLLDINQDDADVEVEIKLIQNEIAEYPTLTFEIDDREKTTLSIDNISVGETPESIVLEKGTHQIHIKRSGYSDYDEKIELDEDKPLLVTLEPKKSTNSDKKKPRNGNNGSGISVGYTRGGNGSTFIQ